MYSNMSYILQDKGLVVIEHYFISSFSKTRPMSQTRQSPAVMFSDIQGFSALMQSDEGKVVRGERGRYQNGFGIFT